MTAFFKEQIVPDHPSERPKQSFARPATSTSSLAATSLSPLPVTRRRRGRSPSPRTARAASASLRAEAGGPWGSLLPRVPLNTPLTTVHAQAH